MNVLETIVGTNDGALVRQIGSQLGLSDDRTTAALGALVPALAAGLHRNAGSPGGLNTLLTALADGGHARYVDNPSSLNQPDAIADGNGILGHVLGSKDVSRQLAAHAAAQTGVGEDVLKRMLPMAAALVMGTLARQSSTPEGVSGAATGSGLMNLLSATAGRESLLDKLAALGGRIFG